MSPCYIATSRSLWDTDNTFQKYIYEQIPLKVVKLFHVPLEWLKRKIQGSSTVTGWCAAALTLGDQVLFAAEPLWVISFKLKMYVW